MKDFAAIDFETANHERSSVCSVGIVIVRNGEIVDSFYSLINPEPRKHLPEKLSDNTVGMHWVNLS